MAQYPEMQKKLNECLEKINSKIHTINKQIGVSTPFIHETIRERRGKPKKRHYSYSFDKFADGLHAPNDLEQPLNNHLLLEWSGIIGHAIRNNVNKHEDTELVGSRERSWKRPRVE